MSTKTCEHKRVGASTWAHTSPCGKPAKVERDGKRYCGIHDPDRRAALTAKNDAARDAAREADLRRNVAWYLPKATDAELRAECARRGLT